MPKKQSFQSTKHHNSFPKPETIRAQYLQAVLGGSVFLEFWLVVVCGVVVVGGFGVVWVGWFLLGLVGVDGGGV